MQKSVVVLAVLSIWMETARVGRDDAAVARIDIVPRGRTAGTGWMDRTDGRTVG